MELGYAYFIRTVTFHYTGRLMTVTDSDITLATPAWIADSGRFNNALRTGELLEVEPIPGTLILNRAAIVDIIRWNHALPQTVK